MSGSEHVRIEDNAKT